MILVLESIPYGMAEYWFSDIEEVRKFLVDLRTRFPRTFDARDYQILMVSGQIDTNNILGDENA